VVLGTETKPNDGGAVGKKLDLEPLSIISLLANTEPQEQTRDKFGKTNCFESDRTRVRTKYVNFDSLGEEEDRFIVPIALESNCAIRRQYSSKKDHDGEQT